MTRSPAYAFFCALITLHAGCGGCGDDAPADPDAEVGPDAEAAPDAAIEPDAMEDDTDPPSSAANPAGGTFFSVPNVTITADEPATIYYTTDGTAPTTGSASGASPLVVTGISAGTPLRFFAVDTAGNTETPDHSETYAIDRAATLSIALDGTVTVTDPVAGVTLAGTAVYTDAADTIDVTLTVTNMEPRLLFNLKAMFGALGQGAVTADGTINGTTFAYYGPEALDAAASKMATFQLTAIDGAVDPVTVELTFRTDPTWATQGNWDESPMLSDSSASGMGVFGDSQPFGYRMTDGDSIYNSAVFSPDGRRLFLASHNMPIVIVKDMTTLEDTVGATLDAGVGAVRWMRLSNDGSSLYVLLITGDHIYPDSGTGGGAGCQSGSGTCANSPPDVVLVELQTSDLTEVGRVTLLADAADKGTRGYLFDISADGTRAAVPIHPPGEIAFVDLTTMTVIDTDSATAGTQNLDVSATYADPHGVAFSADGATLYVVPRQGTGGLVAIDTTTYVATPIAATTAVDRTATGMLVRGPDGRIYDGHRGAPELQIFDPSDSSWVEIDLVSQARGVAFLRDGRYLTHNGATAQVRDPGDDSADVLNADRATGGEDPLFSTNGWGNFLAIGPD
jgi:hypothetical protein